MGSRIDGHARTGAISIVLGMLSLLAPMAFVVCSSIAPRSPEPPSVLIARGERIFFEETFGGNGRTCGTCHRAEENFGLSPALIATLPDDDPLFVAEFNPDLRENFEKPRLMREFGLILENLDGFDDLENRFVLRGVPYLLALRTSVDSAQGPRLGWSGDGSPGDGSLRSFAVGAVIRHFTRTLNRVAGVDFRLPTERELDALEAFLLSLGRQQDLALPLPLKGAVPARGQEVFLDSSLGKCNLCHANAGATSNLGDQDVGNASFNTGVETLPDQPPDLSGELIPPDDGFGIPGAGTFNTPPLVEAADTGPFFHNNAVGTIEGAVAFYSGDAFNRSPAGRFLAGLDPNGVGVRLDATQVVAVAAFLRVINALENIRVSIELLEESARKGFCGRERAKALLERAVDETEDATRVLTDAGLHPRAVKHLREAGTLAKRAARSFLGRPLLIGAAIREQRRARERIIESAPSGLKRPGNGEGEW
jgi:mono/diheme cytochrome c family protein